MADYKDIVGTAVRNNAGNLPSTQKKELFFDTTNIDFKYQFEAVTSAGTWATGNNLNTARRNSGAVGTGTSALCISGNDDPPVLANVEQWDGATWPEIADVNTARGGLRAVGDVSNAVAFGGSPGNKSETEIWNGSGWTEVADLNSGRPAGGKAGSSYTSALFFGGPAPGPLGALNESCNV